MEAINPDIIIVEIELKEEELLKHPLNNLLNFYAKFEDPEEIQTEMKRIYNKTFGGVFKDILIPIAYSYITRPIIMGYKEFKTQTGKTIKKPRNRNTPIGIMFQYKYLGDPNDIEEFYKLFKNKMLEILDLTEYFSPQSLSIYVTKSVTKIINFEEFAITLNPAEIFLKLDVKEEYIRKDDTVASLRRSLLGIKPDDPKKDRTNPNVPEKLKIREKFKKDIKGLVKEEKDKIKEIIQPKEFSLLKKRIEMNNRIYVPSVGVLIHYKYIGDLDNIEEFIDLFNNFFKEYSSKKGDFRRVKPKFEVFLGTSLKRI